MQIEPWQVPILVMAVLALPLSLQSLVRWVRSNSPGSSGDPEQADPLPPGPARTARLERNARRERRRATLYATVAVVLIGLFILALGSEAASILTSVASAVSTLVSAVMAVQSYLMVVQIRRDIRGDPEPAPSESSPPEASTNDHLRDSRGSAGGADDELPRCGELRAGERDGGVEAFEEPGDLAGEVEGGLADGGEGR
jgi:hypothetical protein